MNGSQLIAFFPRLHELRNTLGPVWGCRYFAALASVDCSGVLAVEPLFRAHDLLPISPGRVALRLVEVGAIEYLLGDGRVAAELLIAAALRLLLLCPAIFAGGGPHHTLQI